MNEKQTLDDLLVNAIGLRKDRMKSDLSELEVTFVQKWQELNKKTGISSRTIDCLFQIPCEDNDLDRIKTFPSSLHPIKYSPLGEPTHRDEIVAETVIQWLGTNCGNYFLQQCGFVKIK